MAYPNRWATSIRNWRRPVITPTRFPGDASLFTPGSTREWIDNPQSLLEELVVLQIL